MQSQTEKRVAQILADDGEFLEKGEDGVYIKGRSGNDPVIVAFNEGGYNETNVSLRTVLDWVLKNRQDLVFNIPKSGPPGTYGGPSVPLDELCPNESKHKPAPLKSVGEVVRFSFDALFSESPLLQAYTKLQEAIALVQNIDTISDRISYAMQSIYDVLSIEEQRIITRGLK